MTKKQRKQKKNKKWLFWVLIVVLLVAVGAGTYLVWNLYAKNQETTQKIEEAEQEENVTNEDEVEEAETVEETEGAVPENKVKLYEGENPNEAAELTGVITGTNVVNGNLTIWTNIDQFLNNGRCELVVSKDGRKVYGKTTNIVADVSTSYCEDLSVPVTEIGDGTYQIIVNLSSGEKTGVLNGEATI